MHRSEAVLGSPGYMVKLVYGVWSDHLAAFLYRPIHVVMLESVIFALIMEISLASRALAMSVWYVQQ